MAAGQRPRRLERNLTPRLWCRGRLGTRGGLTGRKRRMGVGTGTVRSARPLLWHSHPRGINVALRWTLEDLVEARCHPLRIIAVVITVPAITFTGGFFFRLPPLPGFGSTRL